MSIHVSNPTSTIASIHMRTAANCSTTCSVCKFLWFWCCRPFIIRLDSDGPVELELPEQWLWDIVDEFIYQYQVFCTWRSKVSTKTQDELMMLAEGGSVRFFFFTSLVRCSFLSPIDLEFLQCFERIVFLDAKVQNQ